MSDPVTNVEVEDVLSSIRRLVSEDKRPKPQVDLSPEPEKLVLTPALRVADDLAEKAPLRLDETLAVRDDDERSQQVAPWQEEDEDYSSEAAWDVEATPVAEHEDPWRAKAEEAWREAQDAASAASAENAASLENDPITETETELLAPATEPALAEEFALDTQQDGWFEDLPEADLTLTEPDDAVLAEPEDLVEAEAEAVMSAQPDTPIEAELETAHPEMPEDEDDLPEATLRAATLSAKIAALEAAVGRRQDDWEPDEPADAIGTSDDPAAMAWEDAVELDSSGAPVNASDQETIEHAQFENELTDDVTDSVMQALAEPETIEAFVEPVADDFAAEGEEQSFEPEPAEQAENDFATFAEESYLDEDTLRDMVGEIVRAELQGALGERITRNVRKLVRREIQRALASQDLE